MDRSQIRWKNVGRLAAGAAGAGALLVVAPGLLDPPDPPPLPADVGLATGATGFVGVAPVPEPESIRPEAEPDGRQSDPDDRRGERKRKVRRRAPTKPSDNVDGASSGPRRRPSAVRPPAAIPATAVPSLPPPAPPAPAPPTVPPPPPIPSQPRPAGPSEFGFER